MMTKMRTICTSVFILSILFLHKFALGDGLGDGLIVRHAIGGQAKSLEINGDYWYQSIGDLLIVLDKHGAPNVSTVMLTPYSAAATCSDLLVFDNQLYALLDGREIVVFDITNPRQPIEIERISLSQLGIVPRELVLVDSQPIVIGDGGAVLLTDGRRLITCNGEVTGLAISIDHGVVYTTDRRIFDAATNTFFGSATQLFDLDDSANANTGTLVYTRALDGETEVGLMASTLRDIDATNANITVAGTARHVLVRGSRLIIATDVAVYVIGIAPAELRLLRTFNIKGVEDIEVIASNYLAVCGTFGRGVYRIDNDRGGEGDTLFRVVRASGSYSAGTYNLKGVHIPQESGSIYYDFGGSVQYTDTSYETVVVPTKAAILGWEAVIDSEGGDVIIMDTIDTRFHLQLPSPAMTVVSVSGNFWIGTVDGIYVYGFDEKMQMNQLGSIQLAGPVVQLIPQFDGSCAFVSESGFVGIVAPAYEIVAFEQ